MAPGMSLGTFWYSGFVIGAGVIALTWMCPARAGLRRVDCFELHKPHKLQPLWPTTPQ